MYNSESPVSRAFHRERPLRSSTRGSISLAAGASAPWRLGLGSFFLFDRLLGLYSSLRLEGMTRISLYHTGVFLQGLCCVGWFYWQASMPHYPSLSSLHRAAVRPLESTALSAQGWDCSFTTGSARQRARSARLGGEGGNITPSPACHSEPERTHCRERQGQEGGGHGSIWL